MSTPAPSCQAITRTSVLRATRHVWRFHSRPPHATTRLSNDMTRTGSTGPERIGRQASVSLDAHGALVSESKQYPATPGIPAETDWTSVRGSSMRSPSRSRQRALRDGAAGQRPGADRQAAPRPPTSGHRPKRHHRSREPRYHHSHAKTTEPLEPQPTPRPNRPRPPPTATYSRPAPAA